ncbi:ArsR family transcriptional regulator [Brevirhabdus pacifica]|uniref:ArsR family transcriptional regulator n=1 Tax=Brevirhabdus pacifica TaxID=1267768 RepID=A0A1U7DGA0_9RHOB|nr:metalloregulator ArsR/SmtB family transcription factor [Brevirhabdus pacifica]APX89030.1 ArsR family transcriptional regulator [Brevirhabdus pacifica]OWU80241.1 hypothetical protein ATO5_04905 [Loktanella sp. 22II-4b]PJJ86400.1 ArsR family transcriptional regulator [Brevirhabdus pacifica]
MKDDADPLAEHVVEAAGLMEMLASPSRLKILCCLTDGESSVGELSGKCRMAQPAMSQQLRRLREAGLVTSRREAQTIYYSLSGREAKAVLGLLHDLYCSRQ